ncbi:ABC transporter substrate-binding protein [Paenibacillus xerothermodurans]|uniref:ABC transporter substrate-binding protein n=2 Tax=Paenibacillus xerothermodurans TaxID=1977292 RepID=A0A2W1NTJ7_PAEXE|nr:ABC transporter substrate-binding protein [Paenibacillus xerothermodurans]
MLSVKFKAICLMSLILLLMLLSACGNSAAGTTDTPSADNAAQPSTVTVKDGMGHDVSIPANPKRVLASYLEDHLAVLGVTPVAQWSVANGVQDYLQAQLAGVPTIAYDLPPETVASFDPDFIIIGSASSVQNGLYEQYSKIAPTYVLGDEIVKDWRETLLKMGELLGKADAAQKAVEDYNRKAADTKAKLESAVGKKSAAILWMTQKQFYIVDNEVASGDVLYGDLGFTPPNLVAGLPDEAKAAWNPITLEKLAELDADYIFLVNSDKGQDAAALNNPVWQGIPAVKAGHVYEMSIQSSWLYSGAVAGEKVIDDVAKALGVQ